jgi:hypothetical protein
MPRRHAAVDPDDYGGEEIKHLTNSAKPPPSRPAPPITYTAQMLTWHLHEALPSTRGFGQPPSSPPDSDHAGRRDCPQNYGKLASEMAQYNTTGPGEGPGAEIPEEPEA